MNLSDIPFKNIEKAGKLFQAICHPSFYSDSVKNINDRLLVLLNSSVDPDMALNNFDRFVNAYFNKSSLYGLMEEIPDSLEMLVKILGESQFLSDVLVRNPEYLLWMLTEGELHHRKDISRYKEQLDEWIGTTRKYNRCMNITRRFQRRELLRIGVRDFLNLADILEITEELSDLASSLVQISVQSALQQLEKEFGKPQKGYDNQKSDAQFCVIGMGKLGGHELNFSSDIDVIFVYDEEGETTRGFSNHEYYSRVGEEIIKFLSKSTEEGKAYRIDLRLRPEGSSGPLVRSLESYELYYQGFAETWERLALIKARCIAGNTELGNKFEKLIIPFVYRRYLDYSSVSEIRNLKIRMQSEIEKKGQSGFEIKSGQGGIREIEFYVSLMQLLHGGRYKELQSRNTCELIHLLINKKLIQSPDGEFLIESYKFFRRVEQKLQLMHQLQTYQIPDEKEVILKLARQLDFKNDEEFIEKLQAYTSGVNQIFQSVFETDTVSELKDRESRIVKILDKSSDQADVLDELRQFGFFDTREALQILYRLSYGDKEHIVSPEERKRFIQIAQDILNSLQKSPNPDLGLRQFARFCNKYGSYRSFYAWLSENKEVLERLIFILGSGEILGEWLIQEPGRLDSIVTRLSTKDLELLAKQPYHPQDISHLSTDELKRIWDEKRLILGILGLLQPENHLKIAKQLTDWADLIINLILTKSFFELHLAESKDLGIAILGLGKIGGQELTIGSDLDLIFVYADEETPSHDKTFKKISILDFSSMCSLVEKLMKEIKSILGEVDIRLRPEGNKGALALSPGSFKQYFEKRASFWERLAWMKSRYIAGNKKLADIVLKYANQFVYELSTSKPVNQEIWSMRIRMQKNIKNSDIEKKDIKIGFGGLVDLEFLIQYYALIHGKKIKSLRLNNLHAVLGRLHKEKIIDAEKYKKIKDNYLFFSKIQYYSRLMSNYSQNQLPENESELSVLSRLMRSDSPDILSEIYSQKAQENRDLFQKILKKK